MGRGGRKARLRQTTIEGREQYVRDNALSLVKTLTEKLDRLREQIRRLLDSQAGFRAQIARERALVDPILEYAWRAHQMETNHLVPVSRCLICNKFGALKLVRRIPYVMG